MRADGCAFTRCTFYPRVSTQRLHPFPHGEQANAHTALAGCLKALSVVSDGERDRLVGDEQVHLYESGLTVAGYVRQRLLSEAEKGLFNAHRERLRSLYIYAQVSDDACLLRPSGCQFAQGSGESLAFQRDRSQFANERCQFLLGLAHKLLCLV